MIGTKFILRMKNDIQNVAHFHIEFCSGVRNEIWHSSLDKQYSRVIHQFHFRNFLMLFSNFRRSKLWRIERWHRLWHFFHLPKMTALYWNVKDPIHVYLIPHWRIRCHSMLYVSSNNKNEFRISLCRRKIYSMAKNLSFYTMYFRFTCTVFTYSESATWLEFILRMTHSPSICHSLLHISPLHSYFLSPFRFIFFRLVSVSNNIIMQVSCSSILKIYIKSYFA